ncbi:MAG TPA: hypothetical protein HA362_03060 [Nanoarchaeota archaeon]|nr:hypothetical protein [Nanoarchaeota archaeon]
MDKWTIYVARGIVSGGRFDPSQIEEGLLIGALPQIVLAGKAQTPDIMRALFEYLSFKDLSGSPLKITAHGTGEFSDTKNLASVNKSIDTIIELNKRAGKPVISKIVFHAGAVHTFEEERKLRESQSYRNVDATFTIEEYLKTMDNVRTNILNAAQYARGYGLTVLVENVGQINFATLPADRMEDKPKELREDPRWGETVWLPERLQLGDVGCAYDLDYLTGDKSQVCIDVEHLGQSVEYSEEFNLEKVKAGTVTEPEKSVLDRFGILVRKGSPILYKAPLNPEDVISRLNNRIAICHLGGQVSMVYEDKGRRVIGSHMPITFGEQENEFISDDESRLRHNLLLEQKLKTDLAALHEAGCRQGVLELHIGPIYAGEKWRHYNQVSLHNVRGIVDSL